ncbi:MAG: hypothetical protein Q9159_001874 [Coniocarpon cinnabarinum]
MASQNSLADMQTRASAKRNVPNTPKNKKGKRSASKMLPSCHPMKTRSQTRAEATLNIICNRSDNVTTVNVWTKGQRSVFRKYEVNARTRTIKLNEKAL